MTILDKFEEVLERLLEKPPYWIFLFVSSVLVIISLLTQSHFKEIWAFFLYSAIGTIWRHAEKDITAVMDTKNLKLLRRIVYHTGNLGLLLGLFLYLGYI